MNREEMIQFVLKSDDTAENTMWKIYQQGRADAIEEFKDLGKLYSEIRADAIDDYTEWLRKTHANFDEDYAEDIKSDYLDWLKEENEWEE